jgi:hypothetical protein
MVIEYSDIFVGVDEKIPVQDWHTPAWHSTTEEDSITVYRDEWREGDELEACFYSYGQGKDPEKNPVILEIHLGGVLDSKNEKMQELEERIQEELKPLIGWEVVKEGDRFARKEIPSDPLTLRPRLLEELKKLEPIAYRIDQMLGYAEDDQELDVATAESSPEE